MGSNEGFKDYAQKWRDLTGRVQPPLSDRELVDMFMGTLFRPFFNPLIESSFAGFIQRDESSSTAKKPFTGKKEVSVAYGQRNLNKIERRPMVGVTMISNSTSNQQQNNQSRTDKPRRQFTRINMTLSRVLPHLMKSNLVTLKEAPNNPNTTSPHYNANA